MKTTHSDAPDIVERLRADLQTARKNRDQLTVEVLQAVLTRITNAEAVPIGFVDGTPGVGTTEVPRKVLSSEEIQAAIQQEFDELTSAHNSMQAYPEHPYTTELAKKIAILSPYLSLSA